MRILMLLEERFPPDIRVENEAASLLDAGHEVHLLCTEDARDKIELPASLERLVVHTTLSRRDLAGWRRRVPNVSLLWFYDARWARRIRELASDVGRFDAIHVHDLPLVRTAQRAAKRMGAVVVADLHENYPMVLPFYTTGKSLSPVGRFLVAPRRWERYEKRSAPHLLGGDRGHRRDEISTRGDRSFRQIGSSSSRTWWTPNGSSRTRSMLRSRSEAAGSVRDHLRRRVRRRSAVSTPPSGPCQPSFVPCPRPS